MDRRQSCFFPHFTDHCVNKGFARLNVPTGEGIALPITLYSVLEQYFVAIFQKA